MISVTNENGVKMDYSIVGEYVTNLFAYYNKALYSFENLKKVFEEYKDAWDSDYEKEFYNHIYNEFIPYAQKTILNSEKYMANLSNTMYKYKELDKA